MREADRTLPPMKNLNFEGLIPIFIGVLLLLMALKIYPRHPQDPEKMELWHQKYGKMVKILSPIVILFGLLLLFRVL